jgi:hypothetical protein
MRPGQKMRDLPTFYPCHLLIQQPVKLIKRSLQLSVLVLKKLDLLIGQVECGQQADTLIEQLGILSAEPFNQGCGFLDLGNEMNPALFKPLAVSSLALGFRTALTGGD